MNAGHYGYELSNGLASLTGNHETINLIRELLQYDEQRVSALLRDILVLMSRECHGTGEGDGENGPYPSSSEPMPSPVPEGSE